MIKHVSAKSSFFRLALSGLACLLVAASATLAHAQTITATPNKEGNTATIEVSTQSRDAKGIVELLDKDGNVVYTVYAGPTKPMPKTVFSYTGLKPGLYTLRYRENLELSFDSEVKRPDRPDGKWTSPADVKITPQNIYVYDAGNVDDNPANRKGGQIFKFNKDLSQDLSFGKAGSLNVGYRPNNTSFAVDEKGSIFIGASHQVSVFDWKGTPQTYRVGSTELHLKDPKVTTTWVNAVALGTDDKIYITSKSPLKVYNKNKNAIDGFLYGIKDKETPILGWGPAIMASHDNVYIADSKNQIIKFTDDGKTLTRKYATAHKPAELIYGPSGMTLSGNLLWVAARGPGPGPFWDSGGGDEILLYWDTGSALQLFQRFGSPGTIPDAVMFHYPTAVAITPDGSKLWVVEDGRGDPKAPQGSPIGNARVRIFDIKPKSTAQTLITVR